MRYLSILLLPLVLTTARVCAQNATAAAPNTVVPIASENLVSTVGIGPFKLGMTVTGVEKILNAKLKLPKNEKDKNSYEPDSASVKYKGTDINLVFGLNTTATDTVPALRIYSIQSNSPQLKTRSGIAIGDDKMKIVTTYTQYRLDIIPDYDKVQNPRKTDIYLYDINSGNQLVFHLYDNLVKGFEVTYSEGD